MKNHKKIYVATLSPHIVSVYGYKIIAHYLFLHNLQCGLIEIMS